MMDMTLRPRLRAMSWASATILTACCSKTSSVGIGFLSFSYCQLKNRIANFSSCCLIKPITKCLNCLKCQNCLKSRYSVCLSNYANMGHPIIICHALTPETCLPSVARRAKGGHLTLPFAGAVRLRPTATDLSTTNPQYSLLQHQFRILTAGFKQLVNLVKGANGLEKLFFGIAFRFFK